MSAAWDDAPPFAWTDDTVPARDDSWEPGLLLRGVFYASLMQGAVIGALVALVVVVLVIAHAL